MYPLRVLIVQSPFVDDLTLDSLLSLEFGLPILDFGLSLLTKAPGMNPGATKFWIRDFRLDFRFRDFRFSPWMNPRACFSFNPKSLHPKSKIALVNISNRNFPKIVGALNFKKLHNSTIMGLPQTFYYLMIKNNQKFVCEQTGNVTVINLLSASDTGH
jgi:hypothetical protein